MGMRVLINAQKTVRTEGGSLSILCIADTVALRFGFEGPDIQRASEDAEPGVVKILLSHCPPVNTQPHADAGVALRLSRHTHGGMIVGFDQVARRTNDGFVSGMYTIDGMKLYVSKGNGLWNGFLMRLGHSWRDY